MSEQSNYEKLAAINVNDKTEKKNGLIYLSWSFAWAEFLKVAPNATYEVVKTPEGLPYFADKTGACVYTIVTVDGISREMWLPVMDGANKAMRDVDYSYNDRYGKEKTVNAYTMFDINKTIMRCLTKNLAMFGLALYIYAGEDLPDGDEQKPVSLITGIQLAQLEKLLKDVSADIGKFCSTFNIKTIAQLPAAQFETAVKMAEAKRK